MSELGGVAVVESPRRSSADRERVLRKKRNLFGKGFHRKRDSLSGHLEKCWDGCCADASFTEMAKVMLSLEEVRDSADLEAPWEDVQEKVARFYLDDDGRTLADPNERKTALKLLLEAFERDGRDFHAPVTSFLANADLQEAVSKREGSEPSTLSRGDKFEKTVDSIETVLRKLSDRD